MDPKRGSVPTMHNTSPYVRTVVAMHNLRDRAKDAVDSWKERDLADRLHEGWGNTRRTVSSRTRNFFTHPENVPCKYIPQEYNYVFRPKSRWELVLLSGTVCGIEFCYAAETAFVTPILLSLGLSIKFVTMIWCLSPLIGLFLTPILGSMSDTCESKFGRRRPFIIMYSIGILLGLILVPNGHHIGLALGDRNYHQPVINQNWIVAFNGTSQNDTKGKGSQVGNLNEKLISNSVGLFNESDQKVTFLSLTKQESKPQLQTALKNVHHNSKKQHRSLDKEDVFPNLRFRSSDGEPFTKSDKGVEEYQRDEVSSLSDLGIDDDETEIDKTENSKEQVQINFNKATFVNRKPDDDDVFPQFKNHFLGLEINKKVEKDLKNSLASSKSRVEEDFSKIYEFPYHLPSKSRLSQNYEEIVKHPNDEEDIFISFMLDKIRFPKERKLRNTSNEKSSFQKTSSENIENDLNSNSDVSFQDPEDEFSQLIDMEDDTDSDELKVETQAITLRNIRKLPRSNDLQDTFPARRIHQGIHGSNDLLNFQTEISVKIENRKIKIDQEEKDAEIDRKRLKRSITAREQSHSSSQRDNSDSSYIQPWSIAFTVMGTVLLDFCSDACQSPSRTYLLDVSLPSDHAAGLSMFTVMAGLGGSIGYMMGALHWETTFLGRWLGGQVNAVFLIVTIIFLIFLFTTVCSFPEIPLSVFRDPKMYEEYQEKIQNVQEDVNEMAVININPKLYGSTDEIVGLKISVSDNDLVEESNLTLVESQKHSMEESPKVIRNDVCEISPNHHKNDETRNFLNPPEVEINESCIEQPTLKEYLRSIVQMPSSLRVLCLTNLFCWMSLVCYSLYFTDFVGECVFGGDPQASQDSLSFLLYQEGVQFGCWGMALYSISCSIYSFFIEALVKKIGAKRVYVGGQLVYSCGMIIMALARHKVAVILLSPTAGVMYSTLFTMPYLLIAHYHCTKQFSNDQKGGDIKVRGIGTDVAAVSSMVFLSQFVLSLTMGSIVEAVGSNVVPVYAAALLSACGALCATQVTYLDI